LSEPGEYAEAAVFYQQVLIEACDQPPRTLLELGCGGGNNASHLKARFELTLVDRAPGMLSVSRALNPECKHVEGDLRVVRLAQHFDCVFIHDAIGYMTTEHDLRKAMQTAFVHCKAGGAALFAPDYIRENFRPSTQYGGHDGEVRSLRYLEWTWDPDPSDSTYTVDFAYLLREKSGSVRVEQDRHVLGLFAQAEWLRLLAEVGFEPSVVPTRHSKPEPAGRAVFLAVKPASGSAMPTADA
jgi:SAM-dependent methyltransferase